MGGDRLGNGGHLGLDGRDILEGVGVGDQADFDVFGLRGGVSCEGHGLVPVKDGLGAVGSGVLEDEEAADDRGVFGEEEFFELDLGNTRLVAFGERPSDEAGFPPVHRGTSCADLDCDPDGFV